MSSPYVSATAPAALKWLGADLARRAGRVAAEMAGKNLTYGRGGRVHATATITWIGDDVVAVVPACHTPALAGPGVAPRPTTAPIDCLKPQCVAARLARIGDPAQPLLAGIEDLTKVTPVA